MIVSVLLSSDNHLSTHLVYCYSMLISLSIISIDCFEYSFTTYSYYC